MFTVNKKVSNLWWDLFRFDTALYQAFLSLIYNFRFGQDFPRFVYIYKSIMVCEKTGKFRQKKLLFLLQCSLYNDRFLHFVIAHQSISGQWFNYGKTALCLSGTLGWNGSDITKYGCFCCNNWQEQLMLQEIIMSSCNKTFNQILSFLSNLTSALFILRIALSSHLSQILSKFLN